MIFEYNLLKEAVTEDFERFYQMGFSETQIFPAVLDEYKHGEDFCLTENICIHMVLALNYAKNGLDFSAIMDKLHHFITEDAEQEVQDALGSDFEKYAVDLAVLIRKASVGNKKAAVGGPQ